MFVAQDHYIVIPVIYVILSPVRHQLVALLARSVSIVTGRQPIEQLEGHDVID